MALLAALAMALAVTPAWSAFAQSGSMPPARPAPQDAIPRELALALLNLGPGIGGSTDIRVGTLPDDIPPEMIPPGSEVLGTMVQFENSVMVLGMPQTPDSAIAALEARLLAAGWTKPQVPENRARGFVGSGLGPQYEMPNVVCRENEFVTLSSTYRRSRGSLLKVSYNRDARYSMCRQRQEVFRSPYDEAPMPTLRAPAASTSVGGSMSSSGPGPGQVITSTRLSTRLKPAEVLAHYDSQMREQGWTGISDGAIDMMAARAYRKKDEKGREWIASLYSILRPNSGEQDVALRLER